MIYNNIKKIHTILPVEGYVLFFMLYDRCVGLHMFRTNQRQTAIYSANNVEPQVYINILPGRSKRPNIRNIFQCNVLGMKNDLPMYNYDSPCAVSEDLVSMPSSMFIGVYTRGTLRNVTHASFVKLCTNLICRYTISHLSVPDTQLIHEVKNTSITHLWIRQPVTYQDLAPLARDFKKLHSLYLSVLLVDGSATTEKLFPALKILHIGKIMLKRNGYEKKSALSEHFPSIENIEIYCNPDKIILN